MLELVEVLNFTLNKQFLVLGSNLSEKETSVENRKSEHHRSILHIRIILNTKFQLKVTAEFLDQIWPKRYLCLK